MLGGDAPLPHAIPMARITPGFRLVGAVELVAKGRYDTLLRVKDGTEGHDFTGYSAFECEVRETDEDGTLLLSPRVSVYIGALPAGFEDEGFTEGQIVDATEGFLRIEAEGTETAVLQTSLESGTLDIFATNGAGEERVRVAKGVWRRSKASTDL